MSGFIQTDLNDRWAAITTADLDDEKKQHIVNFVDWLERNTEPPAATKGSES